MGSGEVFAKHDGYVRATQTLAVMEVLHSLFGIVRAPLFTTVMQIASRILLVWGIAYPFPASTAASPAYTTMLIAWSVTEVIRYSYFVFVLRGAGVPRLWTWLRYNTFLVLYPLGISSECWLVYKAMGPAGKWRQEATWGLGAILAVYVPGSYILFTHMLKQRRKIMSGKGKPE
jgi:very-long-chain (3R)-3-hydroxyacyl-CoA dehydratase